MSLGTLLYTWFRGELVGRDAFGNRYYREKGGKAPVKGGGMESRERRWVLYDGAPEASKVPGEWHAWLHHTVNVVPDESKIARRPWEKTHEPNHTGTAAAYHPPGSLLRGGKRDRATGDYESWTPSA